ncbi:hypothetical protein POM88_042552 [Heracleum sosnowskyi]|uniref:Uncharacterized protein n=1 Tax=Heracleum sosnowskyi TaxID=360622 RepID=A0AAD8MAR9_9APIA|nr:hypothetical protein POM88_042552 [Heracleum sosnowskyi]
MGRPHYTTLQEMAANGTDTSLIEDLLIADHSILIERDKKGNTSCAYRHKKFSSIVDAVSYFESFHSKNIQEFQNLGLYKMEKAISKETFTTFYLRCTWNDLGDLLYMLYDSNLMVYGLRNSDVTPIMRLSSQWIPRAIGSDQMLPLEQYIVPRLAVKCTYFIW